QAPDAEGAGRFIREAEVLRSLRRRDIVWHVAHGRTDSGKFYLAMEWLEGEDLDERLDRGPLPISNRPPRRADSIERARRIAEALGFAHAEGIVHRDVKPSNVFLVGRSLEQIKLLDFGIARRLNAPRLTRRTGKALGTPEYMAPEQARGERVLD